MLPLFLSSLIPAHPALVNAIVLVLHSVAGSTPLPAPETSSRGMSSGSYRDMPGTFSHTDEWGTCRNDVLQDLQTNFCCTDTVIPMLEGEEVWIPELETCTVA